MKMSDDARKIMSTNIQMYMTLNGEDRNALCSAINVPYTTITDWIKANTYPRIDKIEMMANHWGIKKSDLVEAKNSPAVSDEGMSKDKEYLISWIRSSSDEDVAKLRLIVDQVIAARGK